MPEPNRIQEKIEQLQEKGWTLKAIASELDAHPNTVYYWKHGIKKPRWENAILKELAHLKRR